jgi:hypothetical protein
MSVIITNEEQMKKSQATDENDLAKQRRILEILQAYSEFEKNIEEMNNATDIRLESLAKKLEVVIQSSVRLGAMRDGLAEAEERIFFWAQDAVLNEVMQVVTDKKRRDQWE